MISTNQSGQTFPGLTLKAWASVTAAGALVKGFNVTSAAKTSSGRYTLTFTAAMATANYQAKFHVGSICKGSGYINTPATVTLAYITCDAAGVDGDAACYTEVWE